MRNLTLTPERNTLQTFICLIKVITSVSWYDYFIQDIKRHMKITHVLCRCKKYTSTQMLRLSESVWNQRKKCWKQANIHSRDQSRYIRAGYP